VLQMQNVSPESGFDASLRWSRPRDILSRYFYNLKNLLPSHLFMVLPLFDSFSICCTDIRTDKLCALICWTIMISRTYLSVDLNSFPIQFVRSYCCRPLKPVCETLPSPPGNSPPENKGCEVSQRVVDYFVTSFLTRLLSKRVTIC